MEKKETIKNRWDLMDFDCLDDMCTVLTYGAKKHGDTNFLELEHDKAVEKYFAKIMRHLTEYRIRIYYDDETNLPHIIHAMADLMILYTLEQDCRE